MTRKQIKRNEAHLWYARIDKVFDRQALRRYRELLSDEERERTERYRFAKDRDTSVITRALVRCLLSQYTSVEPTRWRFRTNQHGRPEIAKPDLANTLRFNVSHTTGMITVFISENRDVGVDVECLPYIGPYMEVAARFFSPTEEKALRSVPWSEQASKFIKYWVLKESYIKARGLGMSLSLRDFSFRITEKSQERIEIQFSPPYDDPKRWQFNLVAFGDTHIVATAVERRNNQRVQLSMREALPLNGSYSMLYTTASTDRQ